MGANRPNTTYLTRKFSESHEMGVDSWIRSPLTSPPRKDAGAFNIGSDGDRHVLTRS